MKRRICFPGLGIVMIFAGMATLADAHDVDAPDLEISEISIEAERPVAASSQRFIPDQEYVMQPQGRPAQVLRLIPGLVAVEHSGGAGKADQYFLRGFDADHGTDVAFFADGMPINFRSHAHGQGYADLNFIIPETIEGLDAYKGAYHVEFGDFNTAGAVNFKTREMVREGMVQAAGGQFDTQRYLLMLSPTKDKVRTLFAAEGYYTNGPFQNDNRYFRTNLLGKATMNPTPRSELSVTGTFQKSQWNASGEVPLRAVQDGSLDRFGAIDPSEGGKTIRSTARLNYHYDTPSGGRFLQMPTDSITSLISLRTSPFFSTTLSTGMAFSSRTGGSCTEEISATARPYGCWTLTVPSQWACSRG
jgi:outer membrane receptor protein involved in Fe transport